MVTVSDADTGERSTLNPDNDNALDVFNHPHAYAALQAAVPEGGCPAHRGMSRDRSGVMMLARAITAPRTARTSRSIIPHEVRGSSRGAEAAVAITACRHL